MKTAARRVGTRRFRKCTKNLRNANTPSRKNVFVCAAPAVDSPRHRSVRHAVERARPLEPRQNLHGRPLQKTSALCRKTPLLPPKSGALFVASSPQLFFVSRFPLRARVRTQRVFCFLPSPLHLLFSTGCVSVCCG